LDVIEGNALGLRPLGQGMGEEFRTANQPNQQRNTTYLHHYDARRWQAGGELKAHINSPLRKTAHTDEAEPNEPDLDIPVEIERMQTRLAAIEAAKTRLEERQMQRDAQRGRTADDDRKPRDKNGKPEAGMHCPRVLAVPASKAHDSSTVPRSRVMKRDRGRFDYSYSAQTVVNEAAHTIVAPPPELVIERGREGKVLAKSRGAQRDPHSAPMAATFETTQTKLDYRKRKWIAEPPTAGSRRFWGLHN
jgi:hypothetical protein